jgi:hypothetical protein
MWKRRSVLLAAILVVPAILFVAASLLKYNLGWAGLYDALGPFANPGGGFADGVVSAIVLLGPTIAAILALWPILRLRLRRPSGQLEATVSLRLEWANVAIAVVAIGIVGLLVGHLVADAIACSAGATATC